VLELQPSSCQHQTSSAPHRSSKIHHPHLPNTHPNESIVLQLLRCGEHLHIRLGGHGGLLLAVGVGLVGDLGRLECLEVDGGGGLDHVGQGHLAPDVDLGKGRAGGALQQLEAVGEAGVDHHHVACGAARVVGEGVWDGGCAAAAVAARLVQKLDGSRGTKTNP